MGGRPVSSLRWLRFISPAYRYALKAEAEGRYVEAARAYAVVGQSLKVAEMHILEAECQGAPASALRELHVASHFIDEAAESAEGQALLARLGQIYLRILKKSVLTPAEHETCAYAAQILLRAGDPRSAAEAYELAGDLSHAAQAYEQAGEIEKVEALHDQLARSRRIQSEEQELWQRFELHRDLGQRREALACLDRLCHIARDISAAHAQRAALRSRLLSPFVVHLRLQQKGQAAEIVFVGRLPLVLGRGARPPDALDREAATPHDADTSALDLSRGCSVPFADPGLSRHHAQIEWLHEANPSLAVPHLQVFRPSTARFALRDLGSKNGTRLNDLAIMSGAAVPLRGSGEVALGQQVRLHFSTQEDAGLLRLTVTQGLSRGLPIWVGAPPFALRLSHTDHTAAADTTSDSHTEEAAHAAHHTAREPATLPTLHFAEDDGQPWLQASTRIQLHDKPVALRVQLLRGDVLHCDDDLRVEVL